MADPIISGGGGSGGGGPEDDPRGPRVILRREGMLSLAFGFALGITLIVILSLIRKFLPEDSITKSLEQLEWWKVFLFGLIGGTLMSAIYNFLVVRRLNLFGLDSSTD